VQFTQRDGYNAPSTMTDYKTLLTNSLGDGVQSVEHINTFRMDELQQKSSH